MTLAPPGSRVTTLAAPGSRVTTFAAWEAA